MPTRKQRRRELKAKRHEYEYVYVDGEGNELDEVPDELTAPKPVKERAAKAAPQQTKNGRAVRTPPEPSWRRAAKRGGLFAAVIFAFFALTGRGSYASILPFAALYAALFIPFTYVVDRFAYRRYQARIGGAVPAVKASTPKASAPKKR